ncbi:MAG: ATP-binding cassette domain-containing protein [Phycisphaerales bacterium]|nr:ATP-binding cassette domain-containing protein [Phycisphaerales bacterium]
MIELDRVCKRFAASSANAVDSLSLSVEEGEFFALLGGSGSGKTTTLKMINRLIAPTSGSVRVNGEDVATVDGASLRRRIGYVFQGIGLFPHWTVAQNVGAVPRLLDWQRDRIRSRVDELLELVGLPPDEFADREPRALSGGQRQRVGVARALAAEPPVLLMDEPFGALDPLTRDNLQQELRELHARLRLTIVLVTHDMTEAMLLADRIGVMHEGRLLQVGTPSELLRNPSGNIVRDLVATPKRQADRIEQIARGGMDART